MKLKGKNAKKIKDSKKKKMEDTLKRMEDTRVKDSVNLRAQISAKIEKLVVESEKADTYLENLKNKIVEMEELKLRIDGALTALREVSAKPKEGKNDTDV